MMKRVLLSLVTALWSLCGVGWATIQTATTLKTYFEAGDFPTAAQFIDLIDSATNHEIDAQKYATLALAVAALSEGQSLVLTPGTYNVSSAITSALDKITIRGMPGAEVVATGAGYTVLTLTGTDARVEDVVFRGFGTFDTTTATATADKKGLLSLEGARAIVRGCTFTDAESFSVRLRGDYAKVLDNVICGGPYYASAVELDEDRQHYGILLYFAEPSYPEIAGNCFTKNSAGGSAIQWIVGGGGVAECIAGANIHHNTAERSWQHFTYIQCSASNVSDNIMVDCAMKVEMPANSVSLIGNTVARNTLTFTEKAFLNKQGITLVAPKYSTVAENWVDSAMIYGIRLTDPESSSNVGLIGNRIVNNYVANTVSNLVVYTAGIGLECNSAVAGTVANNIISGNTIRTTGDDTSGTNYGIYVQGDVESIALNIGNVVEDNTILDSFEGAMRLEFLSRATVRGNTADGVGVGATASGVQLYYCVDCLLEKNTMIEGSGTMNYGFREDAGGIGAATITIANPGVVTCSAHGLANGDQIIFSTTGALPTGLVAATKYYVASKTADTFRLTATYGGADIETTGTQSGVHTLLALCDRNRYLDNEVRDATTGTLFETNFGYRNLVIGTTSGASGPILYVTAGARTIAMADLYHKVHLRDCNGGDRTDTLPAYTSMDQDLFPNVGSTHEVIYVNTSDAAESITIAGNTGTTILKNEGSTDFAIAQGEAAKLTFIRNGAATVVVLVSKFNP